MSISKPTSNTRNPAKATLEWSAMEGVFTLYDSDKKEKREIAEDISFIVLDQLSSVSGWVKDLGNCKCRETHNLKAAPIQVFAWKDGKSRLIREGMYSELKDELKAMGIKYHKVAYVMLTCDAGGFGAGDLVKLDLGGAAMSEWIECGISDGDEVCVTEPVEVQINKMIKYMKPTFLSKPADEDDLTLAVAADMELQRYFDGRKMESVSVPESEAESALSSAGFEEADGIPF